MSIRYKIIPEKKLVYLLGENKITRNDLFRHWEALAKDPQYIPPMKKLIDYRACVRLGASNAQLGRSLIKKTSLIKKFRGEISAVIVNNDLDFGISRMFAAQLEIYDMKMQVVRSLDDALEALDVQLSDDDLAFDRFKHTFYKDRQGRCRFRRLFEQG